MRTLAELALGAESGGQRKTELKTRMSSGRGRYVMCSASESDDRLEVVARAQQLHADQDPPRSTPSSAAVSSSRSGEPDGADDHVGNRRVVHGLFDDANDDRLGSALKQRSQAHFSIGAGSFRAGAAGCQNVARLAATAFIFFRLC